MSRGPGVPAGKAPIAIVGIGCRFPGGIVDPETFWHVVANGVDAITEIPVERFDVAPFFDPQPGKRGRISTRWGGFIEQRLDEFDAMFFGISSAYAERLDPQQRLLLETSWEALEDAGLDSASLVGSRTAVFVGQWLSDFEHRVFANPANIDFQMAMGSGRYASAGRVSFAFGFRGPSLSIDAACSSGLASVHLAVQSLRTGESALALAGGVNLILEPHIHLAYSHSRMMAPDGRCRFGDATGAGYVRAEGAGMVVLKRLDDAIADGDRVYAVIRGTAVNNDGDSSGALGRPSRIGQEELIRSALRDGGVHQSQLTYVEAHGTGTKVGDPVEIDTLARVLADDRPADAAATWIGSVKTNFGHTEAAAGVAGLIKTALMMQHGQIPPSLHFVTPNPEIAWDTLPVAIPTSLMPWPVPEDERFAGVSSYGIGGTNAHVVLQGAVSPGAGPADEPVDSRAQLLVLSGHTRDALRSRIAGMAAWLESGAGASLPLQVTARTAALRRDRFTYRASVVERTAADAAAALHALVVDDQPRQLTAKRIGFVFPGQGSQWAGMARSLLDAEPVFAAAIEACAAAMRPHLRWSLHDVLRADAMSEDIDVVQPAIFAMQVALAALWRSWGVVPAGVVGHSMGEVAAAYVAGALSLDDACRIICVRSRLMREVRGAGGMAVVELSADDARAALAPFGRALSVAAENSPRSSVVAGDRSALDSLVAELTARGVFAKLVRVDMASHSHHVDPLLPALAEALAATAPVDTGVPMYSTVHGAVVHGSALDAAYWCENLRRTVRLSDAVIAMADASIDLFIEVSPHPVLTSALVETLEARDDDTVVLPSMRRDVDGRTAMLEALGAVYSAGVTPAWAGAFAAGTALVALPTYPFQRERCWYEDASTGTPLAARAMGTDVLLGARINTAADGGGSEWDLRLDAASAPWIADHVVRGSALVPAAAVVQAMLAAARELFGSQATTIELRSVRFAEAIPFAAQGMASLRLTATRPAPGVLAMQVRARDVGDSSVWRTVAHGRAVDLTGTLEAAAPTCVARTDALPTHDRVADSHYVSMQARRLVYGPAFRVVRDVRMLGAKSDAVLTVPTDSAVGNVLLLDGALQVLLDLAPATVAGADETLVPVSIARLRVVQPAWPASAVMQASVNTSDSAPGLRGRVQLATRDGQVLCDADGVEFAVIRGAPADELPAFRLRAVWEPVVLSAAPDRGPESWLVVAESTAELGATERELRSAGDRVTACSPSDLLQIASLPDGVTAIVVLSALGVTAAPAAAADVALRQVYDVPLRVLQLALAAAVAPTRILLVTRGAVAAHVSAEVTSPVQGVLWGLGRVAQREHPELAVQLVDLDGTQSEEEQCRTLSRIARATPEDAELAVRDDLMLAARIVRVPTSDAPAIDGATDGAIDAVYGAEVQTPGLVDTLQWRRVPRAEPGPGEVEIAVAATGLNFINVLSALGTYPDAPGGVGPLGLECAGHVARIGAGVEGLAVGDAVVAVSETALGSHALARAALVARVPDGIDLVQVAGFPIAFLTAARALIDVGRLQRGERVLIHSAAGGVGLAAFQVAQRAGAEIYATAGTPEKRALLQSMGAAGVFDSRTGDFGDEVLRATGGRGVDIVLNSLTGAAIDEGLRVLAPYGRFVEIGKRDIFADRAIGMATLRKQVVVTAVDLLAQLRERADALGDTLRDLLRQLAAGELTLLPSQVFPAAQLSDAFRAFLPGTHVGKVLIAHSVSDLLLLPAKAQVTVRADATYLITGGLGTLGLTAARYLVGRGARTVVLVGRSAAGAAAQEQLDRMRHTGACIQTVELDIGDHAQAERLRDTLSTLPPLRGVIHAAGVLDDGMLTAQNPARMRTVAAAKLIGAMNLQAVLPLQGLDFFVSYSSVASGLGTRGQANYAAANAFLDAQAHALRGRGIPATSIGFGPFAGTGLTTDGRGLEMLRVGGLRALRLAHADAALDAIAGGTHAHEMVANLDAVTWIRQHHGAAEARRVAALLPRLGRAVEAAPAAVGADLRERLAAMVGERQRRDAMRAFARQEVASVLRVSPDRVDPTKALKSLGIDSLLALDLRNRLERATALRLSGTLVFSYPTVEAIADHLREQLFPAASATSVPPIAPVATDPALVGVDAEVDALADTLSTMTEEELLRLLGQTDIGHSS